MRAPGSPVITRLVALPIVTLIYLGAAGSFFWLDAVYGVALAMALPWLLVNVLA